MPPVSIFTYSFSVPQFAIDNYGHVNNVIYLQWMQDAALRHPESVPEYKLPENTGWYAREHRIKYLSPAYLGDEIEVRTWIAEFKRVGGIRRYEFVRKVDGMVLVKGETQWVFVELATGKPIPIPTELLALFPVPADQDEDTTV